MNTDSSLFLFLFLNLALKENVLLIVLSSSAGGLQVMQPGSVRWGPFYLLILVIEGNLPLNN